MDEEYEQANNRSVRGRRESKTVEKSNSSAGRKTCENGESVKEDEREDLVPVVSDVLTTQKSIDVLEETTYRPRSPESTAFDNFDGPDAANDDFDDEDDEDDDEDADEDEEEEDEEEFDHEYK